MAGTPDELAAWIAARGVADERLLAAISRTPRATFVPESQRDRAYEDRALPIGHGQTTSQPTLIAMMLEALELSGDERVIEIGAGGGWQTALLARLASEVWSVEYFAALAEWARERLGSAGIANAEVTVGDGAGGLPERAPFDAAVISAAHPEVPPALAAQLVTGGRVVAPLGPGGAEEVVVLERAANGELIVRRKLTAARFVRLRGAAARVDRPRRRI